MKLNNCENTTHMWQLSKWLVCTNITYTIVIEKIFQASSE